MRIVDVSKRKMAMTGKLSEKQMTWLRGLKIAGRWVPMSATEIGDPEVSEIQSTNLVRILDTLDGRQWQLTGTGETLLAKSLCR